MSTYVLVHGAWHGAWCWNKVVPLLLQQGHHVEALDLPGHGNDQTPVSEITLQSYVDHVVQVIDRQSEPVILVGHSLGGSVITQTAEDSPNKIKTLVYVTAFLLQNGQSIKGPQGIESQEQSSASSYVRVTEDGMGSILTAEGLKECYYNNSSDEDIAYARSRLVPQSRIPGQTPVITTEENFGSVPRVYIECLRDNAVTPSLQKKMYNALPCVKVLSIDTDHSPFFSATEKLAAHLLNI